MKNVLIVLFLILSVSLNAQRGSDEKKIKLSSGSLVFQLSGVIELDGHQMLNDTLSKPFYLKVDLYGMKILKYGEDDVVYCRRNCYKEKCDIIHLELRDSYKFFKPINGNITVTPVAVDSKMFLNQSNNL